MSVNLVKQQFVYNAGGTLQPLMNIPITVNRAPTTNDFALPGQVWINAQDDAIYMLASVTANSANWTTSPGSGVGVFTSVTVNPGDVDVTAGDVNIDAGNLSVTSGNLDVGGDATFAGTVTFNGDIDITSAQLIDLTSTLDAAPSILFEAAGGTSEQIKLSSTLGTAVDSIYLFSNTGGVTIRGDLASADAINLTSPSGGIDIDGALQVNIASSQNAANSIVITSSAGGIDITAPGGSAGEDIDVSANASVNLVGAEAVVDAISITASNAAGGIDVNAGTGGITVDTTGSLSLDSAAASNLTVTGAFDLSVISTAGSIILNAGEAAADAIQLTSSAGGLAASLANNVAISNSSGNITLNSAAGTVLIDSSGVLELNSSAGVIGIGNDAVAQNINVGTGAAARIITIGNATSTTGVAINCGTGGVSVGTSANNHAVTVGSTSGTSSLVLQSGTGDVAVTSTDAVTLDAVGVLELNSSAGVISIGNDAVAQNINIGTGAAARTITVGNNTTTTAVHLTTGTGGLVISSGGNTTMVAATDSQTSPTATAVINAHVGAATYSGFTTASAASQVFVITNSVVTATSQIFVTACNEGANDAQMSVMRVQRGSGTFSVTLKNNGAAALNGNVTITFWVIN